MLWKDVCEIFDKIENTTKRLEKRDYFIKLIDLVKEKGKPEDLKKICYMAIGRVYPEYDERELGIGEKLLINAITSMGIKKEELLEKIKETGDIGFAVEQLKSKTKQLSLLLSPLTVDDVYETLKRVGEIEGEGSQKKKLRLISSLFMRASPIECRYLARLILEDMRLGMNVPTILDALSVYFNVPKEKLEKIYAITNDIGLLAEKLIKNELESEDLKLKLFRPIKPMLAQLAPSIEEALLEMGKAQFETKYDGARVQIHKGGDKVKIYSRRLEDVTNALPEIVDAIKKINVEELIVEGECVAIDKQTGKPRPFQDILRRFRRKYDIGKMMKEINLRVYLFDILYKNGTSLIDEEFEKRRKELEDIVGYENDWRTERERIERELKSDKIVDISYKLVSDDPKEAREFYNWSLSIGHEGVMIKNLKAPYTPGSRVRTMYKFKPTLESLDVVITKAKRGMGKRKDWYGSFEICVKDEEGNLYPIGYVGTGLSEADLEMLKEEIDKIIKRDLGEEVEVEPKIVIEVAYEEIQKSDKYPCGYALRFPRVVRFRFDKGKDDINTVKDVERIYEIQRGRK
ncbi:DNA ligase I, ATP-dependent Dnl1 [Methanocaldococcus vulcanius M7]|uniref:DNA ligase n=1 Tax=Methanocaldococcus vulcanius (strain ATCC 700851 / DSM 12094 / M7) TaxID=579137 RepID=C9RDY7_METVM|nr:ATP-dependent DNA ligase [Methanocaldococcus vulcanius]ACX73516.1 DNA ligase I, ATP-dependent Dnl1 [Methanocaldococcus vulcanius M7]